MPRLRVYELARKLNMPTKELLQELEDLGLEVKNHMSFIDAETVSLLLEIFEEEEKSVAKAVKQVKPKKAVPDEEKEESAKEEIKEEISLSSEEMNLTVLAAKMGVAVNRIIQDAFAKGKVLKPNQNLNEEEIKEIAREYGYKVKISRTEPSEESKEELDSTAQHLEKKFEELYEKHPDKLVERPPVVTIMGHVDHGKTTLLDKIRKTRVAEKEAGGITQSIGAYQITHNGKKITFIDTPGHELFTEMRARGAQVTDIVVLVVAADDGVMPQTVEAYDHAKAAGVPVVVAINKIDKPNANVEATKQQLVSKLNIVPEDWGGDTVVVPLSARTGEGIENLLEMILLVAELREIKCFPEGNARCVIIESKVDKTLGPVANAIVKDGILRVGDHVVCGSTYGKVRVLIDDSGKRIKKAVPSQPVMIVGFNDIPDVRSAVYVVADLETARSLSEKVKEKQRQAKVSRKSVKLEELLKMMEDSEKKELNIVLKADTTGSLNAVQNAILSIKTDEIIVKIIHTGVGAVTNGDVMLASASKGIIVGFRVKADAQARRSAESEGVQIRLYDVIYKLLDEMKLALEGMLEPEEMEETIGRGEIRKTFKVSKIGTIAGVQLSEGYVTKDSTVKVYRDGVLLFTDTIDSLKHYQQDVNQVSAPQECGIKLKVREDFQEGDELEFCVIRKIQRKLEDSSTSS